jgi:hypothetical protein
MQNVAALPVKDAQGSGPSCMAAVNLWTLGGLDFQWTLRPWTDNRAVFPMADAFIRMASVTGRNAMITNACLLRAILHIATRARRFGGLLTRWGVPLASTVTSGADKWCASTRHQATCALMPRCWRMCDLRQWPYPSCQCWDQSKQLLRSRALRHPIVELLPGAWAASPAVRCSDDGNRQFAQRTLHVCHDLRKHLSCHAIVKSMPSCTQSHQRISSPILLIPTTPGTDQGLTILPCTPFLCHPHAPAHPTRLATL